MYAIRSYYEINQTYEKVYMLEQRGEDTCGIIKNIHVER